MPALRGSDETADEIIAARRRADAQGIIREVHDYCASRCPRRERCPGMECRQYQREMTARDELLSMDDAEYPEEEDAR